MTSTDVPTKCSDCGSCYITFDEKRGENFCEECGLCVSKPIESTASGYSGSENQTHSADYGNLGSRIERTDLGNVGHGAKITKELRDAIYRTRSLNKSEKDTQTIELSKEILNHLRSNLNPNKTERHIAEEKRMMKILRNSSLHEYNSGVNKRLFQGYPVEITATVMSWLIHNFLRDLGLSQSQIMTKISESFEKPDFPASLSVGDHKQLYNCLKKFWRRFKTEKWVTAKHKETHELSAKNEIDVFVKKLIDNNTLPNTFSLSESVSTKLFEIEKYPLNPNKTRDAIHSEIIYQFAIKQGVKGVSRKRITVAAGLSSSNDNHKNKVSQFLTMVLGE